MAFLASFIKYLLTLVFMVIVAGIGIFTGKKLRDRKDAKAASEVSDAEIKE